MQSHVKVLAILHIVFGVLGVLIGLGVFVLFGGIVGLVQHDNDPDAAEVVPILGAIGGLVLVVLLALSVPGIVAGVGSRSAFVPALGAYFDDRALNTGLGEYPSRNCSRRLWPVGPVHHRGRATL